MERKFSYSVNTKERMNTYETNDETFSQRCSLFVYVCWNGVVCWGRFQSLKQNESDWKQWFFKQFCFYGEIH